MMIFGGLLVVVHLAVILFFAVHERFFNAFKPTVSLANMHTRVYTGVIVAIVICITSISVFTGLTIVKTALHDEHANYVMVARLFKHEKNMDELMCSYVENVALEFKLKPIEYICLLEQYKSGLHYSMIQLK